MHHSTCSATTLPLPRPTTKNHNDVFMPLPEGFYAKLFRASIQIAFAQMGATAESIGDLGALGGDGFWCLDGKIYYSIGGYDGEYDPKTFAWKDKYWNNRPDLYGRYIWTDGVDVYSSYGTDSDDLDYILDKETETWSPLRTNRPDHFYAMRIWTDGINVYYSDECSQLQWDKTKKEWFPVTWEGIPQYFNGFDIWKGPDEEVYCSGPASPNRQADGGGGIASGGTNSTWKINKGTHTWVNIPQYKNNGEEIQLYRDALWYDGEKMRYNRSEASYERRADGFWYEIPAIYFSKQSEDTLTGDGFWSDGENIFYSDNGGNTAGQGILLPQNSRLVMYTNRGWQEIGALTGNTL